MLEAFLFLLGVVVGIYNKLKRSVGAWLHLKHKLNKLLLADPATPRLLNRFNLCVWELPQLIHAILRGIPNNDLLHCFNGLGQTISLQIYATCNLQAANVKQ